MIDRDHALPITRQASLLGISRGSVYYLPRRLGAADLVLMRRIDELHLEHQFVERLWRSVKYERVYLKAYDSVSAARADIADIADYLGWYNAERAHSSLADLTPDEHYLAKLPALALAA